VSLPHHTHFTQKTFTPQGADKNPPHNILLANIFPELLTKFFFNLSFLKFHQRTIAKSLSFGIKERLFTTQNQTKFKK
jgi:hypothetical protein